jgi:hypothetical protein
MTEGVADVKKISPGKNSWGMLSFRCFNLYYYAGINNVV